MNVTKCGLLLLLTLLIASFGSAQPMASGEDLKKEQATLAKLQKAQVAAKAAFAKKPKDAKTKEAYVAATVKLGTATMVSAALPPKDKYRGALKWYKEALKVDPKNKEAKNNTDMIVSIYKSMGRPVPKV